MFVAQSIYQTSHTQTHLAHKHRHTLHTQTHLAHTDTPRTRTHLCSPGAVKAGRPCSATFALCSPSVHWARSSRASRRSVSRPARWPPEAPSRSSLSSVAKDQPEASFLLILSSSPGPSPARPDHHPPGPTKAVPKVYPKSLDLDSYSSYKLEFASDDSKVSFRCCPIRR